VDDDRHGVFDALSGHTVMGAPVRWWTRFVAWLRPMPVVVSVPMPPIHVAAPVPEPFVRGACGECVFWDRRDKATGWCRAHAPVHVDLSTLGHPVAFWGLTASTKWCGDFRRV
jgi:hypothetical protein